MIQGYLFNNEIVKKDTKACDFHVFLNVPEAMMEQSLIDFRAGLKNDYAMLKSLREDLLVEGVVVGHYEKSAYTKTVPTK